MKNYEIKSEKKELKNENRRALIHELLAHFDNLQEFREAYPNIYNTAHRLGVFDDYNWLEKNYICLDTQELDDEVLVQFRDTNYYLNRKGECFNSKTGRKLQPVKNANDYYKWNLRIDGKNHQVYCQIAVWSSWVGEIPEGFEINHLDYDRSNNSLENLDVRSRQENMNYSMVRIKDAHRTISNNNIIEFKEYISTLDENTKVNYSYYQDKYNVSYNCLYGIATGRTWCDVE
ncbi:hypothetical protein GCQ56_07640 [Marinifilum sp. N1E240]|uniref:HNH endonuclease signature motif containing protein n=1 Tax=Marinifilum sp. N1E240 TaxID=2608082 RepID=UPI00128B6687|nr:HNH endonuclease signature motif containing protein [Marinifilum sp. N1E240]MPQ46885.1 hypothetical protein [Marinifilum sp. N1E240]